MTLNSLYNENTAALRKRYEILRGEIIDTITKVLKDLPENSLDISQTSATCAIEQIDDQESVVAMGLTLNSKGYVTVHAGVHDECSQYSLRDLWFETLLDLYECFEEAVNDDPYPYVVE